MACDFAGLEVLLAGLDRTQLQTLIWRLVERVPPMAEIVEKEIQRLHEDPAATASFPPTRSRPDPASIDVDAIRRQIRDILQEPEDFDSFSDVWYASTAVAGVRQALQQALSFVYAGDGRTAITILEAVTTEYMNGWEMLDDSDGDASGFFADLAKAWAEAIPAANLSAAERDALVGKLAAWSEELEDCGVGDTFVATIEASRGG